MKKRKIKIFQITIPIAIVGLIAVFGLSYLYTYSKSQNVDEYLKDSELVKVKEDDGQYFFDGPGKENLFVFYPGGKVDEKAYSPLLNLLAKNGLDCYLLRVPFHLAIFSPNKAGDVIDSYSYTNYYVGGHSLGGVAASIYANKNEEKVKGLIYLASCSQEDLSKKDFKILSIYGTKDGVFTKENLDRNRKNMPLDYTEYEIEGGNHAQFGSYGKQDQDLEATITFQEQLDITVKTIISWLEKNQ